MSGYPILIADWTGKQAMTIVCESCHAEAVITDDDLQNEGLYSCPKHCGGLAVYKYEQADKCGGCGKLGFYDSKINDGCCSRVCQLQAEYAKDLATRKATA